MNKQTVSQLVLSFRWDIYTWAGLGLLLEYRDLKYGTTEKIEVGFKLKTIVLSYFYGTTL